MADRTPLPALFGLQGRDEAIRAVAVALLLLAGFTGSAFFTFAVGSISLFPYRILLVVMGGCVLVRHASTVSLASRPSVRSPLVLSVSAMVYAGVTLLWTPDLLLGIRHLVLMGSGLTAMLLVAGLARTEGALRAVSGAWALGTGLLLLMAFVEHILGVHIPQSNFYQTVDWRFLHVPTATFVNPNDLAALLAFSIPFSAAAFRHGKGRILPWMGLLLTVAAFYIVHAAQSRAAVLAVLCQSVVLVVLILRRRRSPEHARERRRGWILLAALAAVVLIAEVSPLIHVEPDPDVVLPPSGELDSLSTRVNLALNGWEAIKSTYGLGVGIGGWEEWFNANARFETEGILAQHNWWLEIGTTLGLPFLLAYVAIYLGTLWRCWRARLRARSKPERMLTEVALLGLVGFSFASLGPSNLLGFAPQWLFWGFAAAVLAWTRRRPQEGSE